MPYQSVLTAAPPPASSSGGRGYQSAFGYNVPQAPPAAHLAVMRGKLPTAGKVDEINIALGRLKKYKVEDQVRVINQAIRAGVVDKSKGADYTRAILTQANPVQAPKLNKLEQVVNLGVQAGKGIYTGTVAPVVNKIEQQVKYLSGPTSTEAQRKDILKNQNVKLPKTSGDVGAAAGIEARKMAASGASPKEIQQYLQKAARTFGENERRGLGSAITLASLAAGGGSLAGVKGIAGATKAVAPVALASGAGNAGSTLATNPNATAKDIAKSAAVGTAVGAALPFAGAAVRKGVEEVGSKIRPAKVPETKLKINNPTGADVGKAGKIPEAPSVAPETTIHLPKQGIYAKLTPEQAVHLKNEIGNVASSGNDIVHLSAPTEALTRGSKQVSLDEIKAVSPNARKTLEATPTSTSPTLASVSAKVGPPESAAVPTPSVGSTKTGTSKIAKSTETAAIQKKLATGFKDLAGYEKRDVKGQAEKVATMISSDTDKVRRIIQGKEAVPEGLSGSMLHNGVTQHALKTGDVDLLKDLARSPIASETSVHAQELRFLRERQPNDPVAHIQAVNKSFQKAAERRLGTTVAKAQKKEVAAIKTKIASPTKDEWQNFISGLQCK